jgi:hypothetical protein
MAEGYTIPAGPRVAVRQDRRSGKATFFAAMSSISAAL